MSVERDQCLTYPSVIGQVMDHKRIEGVTREEAQEARRHAAEIGDYVTAKRWRWHERLLATHSAGSSAGKGIGTEA